MGSDLTVAVVGPAGLVSPEILELLEVAGSDATHVGRMRDDPSADPPGLVLWIALDNVRKGAALNAVQIAEILARDHL